MRHMLPFYLSVKFLLLILAAAAVFQLVVMAGLVPGEMVWGGRLSSDQERTVGAVVSLTVLLLMITITLVRAGVIGAAFPAVGRWGMWAITALFALNTVGNLFAVDGRETLIFAPVTAIAALLAWRVALGPKSE